MAEANLRRCSSCKQYLPLTSFSTHVRHSRGGKTYFNSRCDDCGRAAANDHYKANRERCLQTVTAYRARNKEKINASNRNYWAANRERILPKKREYQRRIEKTPEHKAKRLIFVESHREQLNANARRWRERNPERRRAVVKANKIKRASAVGKCSMDQWTAKVEYFGWRCYLCGIPVSSKTLHMDHRKPLARGGSHWPANLAPACGPCNLRKNNKTEAEFRIKMCQRLVETVSL